jgi:hypothetical protein
MDLGEFGKRKRAVCGKNGERETGEILDAVMLRGGLVGDG